MRLLREENRNVTWTPQGVRSSRIRRDEVVVPPHYMGDPDMAYEDIVTKYYPFPETPMEPMLTARRERALRDPSKPMHFGENSPMTNGQAYSHQLPPSQPPSLEAPRQQSWVGVRPNMHHPSSNNQSPLGDWQPPPFPLTPLDEASPATPPRRNPYPSQYYPPPTHQQYVPAYPATPPMYVMAPSPYVQSQAYYGAPYHPYPAMLPTVQQPPLHPTNYQAAAIRPPSSGPSSLGSRGYYPQASHYSGEWYGSVPAPNSPSRPPQPLRTDSLAARMRQRNGPPPPEDEEVSTVQHANTVPSGRSRTSGKSSTVGDNFPVAIQDDDYFGDVQEEEEVVPINRSTRSVSSASSHRPAEKRKRSSLGGYSFRRASSEGGRRASDGEVRRGRPRKTVLERDRSPSVISRSSRLRAPSVVSSASGITRKKKPTLAVYVRRRTNKVQPKNRREEVVYFDAQILQTGKRARLPPLPGWEGARYIYDTRNNVIGYAGFVDDSHPKLVLPPVRKGKKKVVSEFAAIGNVSARPGRIRLSEASSVAPALMLDPYSRVAEAAADLEVMEMRSRTRDVAQAEQRTELMLQLQDRGVKRPRGRPPKRRVSDGMLSEAGLTRGMPSVRASSTPGTELVEQPQGTWRMGEDTVISSGKYREWRSEETEEGGVLPVAVSIRGKRCVLAEALLRPQSKKELELVSEGTAVDVTVLECAEGDPLEVTLVKAAEIKTFRLGFGGTLAVPSGASYALSNSSKKKDAKLLIAMLRSPFNSSNSLHA